MNERDQFEAHIKSTAWYRVLSEAAKEDDEGASVFRMARMAASEAWQASRRAALEEAAAEITKGISQVKENGWTDCANERLRCADAIRALAGATET
jgi:hypothetical protein